MPTISQVRPRRPKPREKARLSLDKWVMRVNREIQKRKRWRDEVKWRTEGYVPGEKFKQLRLDEKTGAAVGLGHRDLQTGFRDLRRQARTRGPS